jgi:XTP/dITP diphosphohydrolase
VSPAADPRGSGRLVLLASTHRVAPGLLTLPAWDTLRGAGRVLAGAADHPQLPALAAAGIPVEIVTVGSAEVLARTLLAAAAGTVVVWVAGTDGDPGLAAALGRAAAGAADLPEIEALPGSYDLPGSRLLDLVAVMDRLRSPGGCPWDAAQTHESLLPFLLEEAYETAEAVETGDLVGLREELGDLLLQVVFHARIGQEHAEQPWSVDDVAGGIVDKLVSRHPHVFGDTEAPTAAHVEANWERLKAAEKGRTSAVDGLAWGQPALSLAAKLLSRARRAGLPPPASDPTDDVGAALLALVASATQRGIDPELALRAAARRYAAWVRAVEAGPPRRPEPPAATRPARR